MNQPMDLRAILAVLLIAQVAAFAVVVLLKTGGLRRFLLERRIAGYLANANAPLQVSSAPADRWSKITRALLWDLTEAQRVAILWLGAKYRLDPEASLRTFAVIRIAALALGWGAAVTVIGLVFDNEPLGLLVAAVGGVALAGVNWWLTRRYAASLARMRQENISFGMPYALDLVLICLDSGVALEAAISRVAAELSLRDPLVSEELYRTLLDINVLGSREQAFRNLGERIDTVNMRSIVTVLCQALQYGSSLATSLKDAIQNMKRVELLDLEERAGKLPVQLTLPGMIFTLPQVIILLAGPGVISLLETLTSA